MRVLGVDPGLTRCGLGVVEGLPGRRAALVAVDVIRTPADADLATRLLAIEEAVGGWLDQTRPQVVAVERVFSQQNVRTVMGTAQAAAAATLAAARRGLPVALHTPSEVKAAVTGSGRADKAQVTAMVTRILQLPARPSPADAADALALAICHLWRGAGGTPPSVVQPGGTQLTGTGSTGTRSGAQPSASTPAQRQWLEAQRRARAASRAAGRLAAGRPARRRPTG